jgi:hypothetical protein
MSKSTVLVENLTFRAAIALHEQGSIFLGYASGDVIVPSVLNGEDLVVTLKDLKVRIGVNGNKLIQPPTRTFVVRGEERRSALYWIDGPTRDFLTDAIFALHGVQTTLKQAIAMSKEEIPS